MIDLLSLQRKIESEIAGSKASIQDMDGAGRHFEVRVISSEFAGVSLLERHRKVYAALGSVVGNELHAAKLVTLTPEEEVKRR